jgi:hypothetical protein
MLPTLGGILVTNPLYWKPVPLVTCNVTWVHSNGAKIWYYNVAVGSWVSDGGVKLSQGVNNTCSHLSEWQSFDYHSSVQPDMSTNNIGKYLATYTFNFILDSDYEPKAGCIKSAIAEAGGPNLVPRTSCMDYWRFPAPREGLMSGQRRREIALTVRLGSIFRVTRRQTLVLAPPTALVLGYNN